MADGYLIGADLLGRIRRTVDAAEAAPMRLQTGKIAVRLEGEESTPAKVFRICTFTGAWSVGAAKRVTFKYQTATPNTLTAVNLFWPIPGGSERDCAVARDGTSWHLIVPQLYAASAATAAELNTSALVFDTLPVVALATSSTFTFSVSAATCTT